MHYKHCQRRSYSNNLAVQAAPDCGIHITMMSREQYLSQVRSADLAQLEESDISPMILRSLVAGRSFSRLPFLCPPHPMVQTHAKEKMFLHGILDTRGVTRIGHATACMDLPCEWAQFLYTCAERGLEDSALILIAIWHRQGTTLESTSLCHNPMVIVALNRTIRDGASYVNCLTPIPEEWLVEKDWFMRSHCCHQAPHRKFVQLTHW